MITIIHSNVRFSVFAAIDRSSCNPVVQEPLSEESCPGADFMPVAPLDKGAESYYYGNNKFGAPMIELKVRRFGNSLGVVLPKEVIKRLNTEDGAPLFLIESPDGSYQLTPYDPEFEKKMTKADELMQRYRNTLHVLSK